MKNINEKLKYLIKKINSDEFYNNRGLANEVPFYIFDYDPKEEITIRHFVKEELMPKFKDDKRMKIVEIDLFELMLESLEKDKILEKSMKMEEKRGTKHLYEKLKKSFNPKTVTEYIFKKSSGKNLILLTGVGKVYPIVRTHAILNNLQNIFDHTKVILFFPGEYTNIDLRLFGFKDNNYYRAFRIEDPKV